MQQNPLEHGQTDIRYAYKRVVKKKISLWFVFYFLFVFKYFFLRGIVVKLKSSFSLSIYRETKGSFDFQPSDKKKYFDHLMCFSFFDSRRLTSCSRGVHTLKYYGPQNVVEKSKKKKDTVLLPKQSLLRDLAECMCICVDVAIHTILHRHFNFFQFCQLVCLKCHAMRFYYCIADHKKKESETITNHSWKIITTQFYLSLLVFFFIPMFVLILFHIEKCYSLFIKPT